MTMLETLKLHRKISTKETALIITLKYFPLLFKEHLNHGEKLWIALKNFLCYSLLLFPGFSVTLTRFSGWFSVSQFHNDTNYICVVGSAYSSIAQRLWELNTAKLGVIENEILLQNVGNIIWIRTYKHWFKIQPNKSDNFCVFYCLCNPSTICTFGNNWPVVAPEIFCGGIEGQKCIAEGAKIQNQKFAKNGWFWPFFLLMRGASGGRASDWGKMPHAPPWCRHYNWSISLGSVVKGCFANGVQSIRKMKFEFDWLQTHFPSSQHI